MTRLEYLLILNSIQDIGFIRFNNLIKRFGSVQAVFKATRPQLEGVENIGPKIAERILSADKTGIISAEMELIDKYAVTVLSYYDKGYPENLKNIYDPPILLYVKGKLVPEDGYAIAIVGSRAASGYGITTAGRISCELAEKGITVVSGLAKGIDAAAHKGALKIKGRTVAVLGSGLAEVYPPQHKDLSEEISLNGAVISEFPMRLAPLKENFPRRNRIISGLSLGVVVVEASRNSGALITADFALEQGRELFAVPGQARARTSFGPNMLIRQGAKLVESADDVIEEIGDMLKGQLREKDEVKDGAYDLEDLEKKVFDAVSFEPKSVDEIVVNAGLGVREALSSFTKLELRGLVKRLDGALYVRKG